MATEAELAAMKQQFIAAGVMDPTTSLQVLADGVPITDTSVIRLDWPDGGLQNLDVYAVFAAGIAAITNRP